MKKDETNKADAVKNVLRNGINWILDHTKIVMPIVLLICVLTTIVIAVNANKKEQIAQEAELAAASAGADQKSGITVSKLTIPELPLEENAYPEINREVEEYYKALADGDMETVSRYSKYLDEDEIAKIKAEEVAKYIEQYEKIDVYTKVGLSDGSYVAYVCSEVKFVDAEQALPGCQVYYISKEDDETYSIIAAGSIESSVYDYIKEVSLQDDVVELNNKIVVAYNDLLANNEELEEYVAYITEKIKENVGEILAAAEQQALEGEDILLADAGTEEDTNAEEVSPESDQSDGPATGTKVVATDVVNIRSSDSETADKLDKAQIGQEFTLIEQKGNGWSQIKYENGEAYIKTEFLEVVEGGIPVNQETAASEETEPAQAAQNVSTDGTVTVKESVRVRAKDSTEAESLGTVYEGEKLDFIEKQSNGWTKVKYKDKIGYVKSDFVE